MTERLSLTEYRKMMGLISATDPAPVRRRDMRWHHELHRQMTMSPKLAGLELVSEYKFHPERQFRADWALPSLMLLIECEGIGGTSRHTSFTGYTNDCEKYTEAAILGFRVVRVTQGHIKSGQAIAWIERAVEGR